MAGLSRVRCDLDFDSAGQQAGYLRAPLSRNTDGWETVKIPITVAKNGTGPTVLFTSGILGDEYEGQIAITRLACNLDLAQIQNRVIMLPMVNVPAALNDTRLSPVDNWDIYRGFPGEPHKTGNIALVVLSHSASLFDRALYYANGCDPEDFDLIVVSHRTPSTRRITRGLMRTSTSTLQAPPRPTCRLSAT